MFAFVASVLLAASVLSFVPFVIFVFARSACYVCMVIAVRMCDCKLS